MKPAELGSVAVTVSETDTTPVAGTSAARSVTCTSSELPPWILALVTVRRACGLCPGRVSKMRLGPAEVKALPAGNQPLVLTTMSVGGVLKKHTVSAGETGAITALATGLPALEFTLDT